MLCLDYFYTFNQIILLELIVMAYFNVHFQKIFLSDNTDIFRKKIKKYLKYF